MFIAQGLLAVAPDDQRTGAAYLQSHHDYKLVRGDDAVVGGTAMGGHPSVLLFSLDFDHLWERREQVTLAGTTGSGNLAPEDLLWSSCTVQTSMATAGVDCDVAELIALRTDEWRRVL